MWLMLSHMNGASQGTYIPFPDSNATWTTGIYLGPDFQYLYTHYLEPEKEDTVIGGMTYNVLKGYSGEAPGEMCGGLRDDGNGRVYYYNPSSDQEFLLYDFTLDVGDTATVYVGSYWGVGTALCDPDAEWVWLQVMEVVEVDTVVIQNKSRKRQYMISGGGYFMQQYWIEGIGGEGGLLTTPFTDISSTPWLHCMSANDTIWAGYRGYLEPDPGPGNCFTVGISEAGLYRDAPWFHPTLAADRIHLRQGLHARIVEVYSSAGLLLRRITPAGDLITIGGLPPGSYLLRSEDIHGVVRHGRFVKE